MYADIKFDMILDDSVEFFNRKKGSKKKIAIFTSSQRIFTKHITLELTNLEIKAAKLYLDCLYFYVSRMAQDIIGESLICKSS